MTTNRLTVGLEGVAGPTVRVCAPEEELQAMLERLPRPFGVAGGEQPVTWQIEVRVASLEGQWPDAARVLRVFRPGGTEPFPWYVERETALGCIAWLHDETADERASIHIDLPSRTIELVQEQRRGRWLTRIVKNVFSASLTDEGWIPLHACAFAAEGRAIVCAGERGSGKSTLAFLAASLKGAGYLSDDIVLIRPTGIGQSWDVLGWPARVGIRRALLEQVFGTERIRKLEPRLRRAVLPSRMHPRGERLAFDPDELVSKLGIAYLGHVRGSLRLATVEAIAGDVPQVSFTRGYFDRRLEACGFNRRYLIDPVGLFARKAGPPMPLLDPCSVPIDTGVVRLPHDVPAALDAVWPRLALSSASTIEGQGAVLA